MNFLNSSLERWNVGAKKQRVQKKIFFKGKMMKKKKIKKYVRKPIPPARKRKYNLHYLIRKQGYTVDSYKKTIYVPFTKSIFSAQVNQLRQEFNYVVQTQIV